MASSERGLRRRLPKRAVGTVPAAMLVAAASSSVGWLALAAVDTNHSGVWLLQAPVFFAQAWAVLLVARRTHVTLVRVLTALVVGSLLGTVATLVPHIAWYHLTGLWVRGGWIDVGLDFDALNLIRAIVPHLLASLLLAAALVRAETRLLLPLAGILAGVIQAMATSAVGAPLQGWFASTALLVCHAAALGVFLPLVSWLADQIHPLVERTRRRVWPVIAAVWALPPAVLLVGGFIAPERFMGGVDQAGLVPIVWLLDLIRSQEHGLSHPNYVQHAAVCLIVLATAVGLCPGRRWVWIPWLAWLLHDLAYAGLLVWLIAGLVHNVGVAASDPVGRSALVATWPSFACLVGIGYIQVCRVVALPCRGVRPIW